jgi:uncharacterized protein YjbI with pentapeptide repeats
MDAKRSQYYWMLSCLFVLLLGVSFIVAAYWFNWPHTGFQNKTVWDWLQLLIIPLVLAMAALFFNQMNTRTEQQIAQQRYKLDQEIALDTQREDLLQTYLDRLSELLLEKNLDNIQIDQKARKVVRVRTISILIRLDATRVGYVFALLRDAGLVERNNPAISFHEANFVRVDWSEASLSETNLSRATLTEAKLTGANLNNSDLSETNLTGANLTGADLSSANLTGADLFTAILSKAILTETKLSNASLISANLSHAKLIEANLSNANLSEATLISANLSYTKLIGANLSNANLSEADLGYANLISANLSNANLIGANLSNANLNYAKLAGALVNKGMLTPEQIAQAEW